jgi:hypothetical protein
MALVFLTVCGNEAWAQEAPKAPPLTAMSDAEVQKQLVEIQAHLDEAEISSEQWYYGWISGYAGITATQAVVFGLNKNKDLSPQLGLGIAGSSLGLLATMFGPNPGLEGGTVIHRLPKNTPAQRKFALEQARKRLQAMAKSDALATSWIARVLGLSVATGQALVLALVFDQPGKAVLQGLTSAAVGQFQIWTRPTSSISSWEQLKPKTVKNLSFHVGPLFWSVSAQF